MKEASLLMERRSSVSAVQSYFWQRLVTRLRSWFKIPYGYEDQNGFHYGLETMPPQLTAGTAAARKVYTDRACHAMLSPSPIGLQAVEAPRLSRERRKRAVPE